MAIIENVFFGFWQGIGDYFIFCLGFAIFIGIFCAIFDLFIPR